MERRPFFSIIMATYNSERTIKYALESIQNQTIDKNELEIIVIDGGSTDQTKEIAQNYNAIIYDNPKRLPEYAKAIGTSNAHGHYVLRMDSDEELSFDNQLEERMIFLKSHPEIKIMMSNCCKRGRDDICGIAADYMNILGDPFSYFMYKTKKDKCSTYRNNVIEENEKYAIFRFDKDDVYPLNDSALGGISLDFIRTNYPNDYDSISFTCSAYDIVMDDTGLCGCMKDDIILHNCSSSLKTYFSKLKFRVINNLFHKEESGYSLKEGRNDNLRKRKYLFLLYAIIFPLPILDSFRLSIIYKNPTYLLHFIYLYYVCIEVALLLSKKLLGKTIYNEKYGE